MKKFLAVIFASLLLVSCGGKTEPLETATTKDFVTSDFELSYPKNWNTQSGEIDFATVYAFDSLKLIAFSRAPEDSLDGPLLSFEDTNAKFKAAFDKAGEVNIAEPDNGLSVTIITYKESVEPFIYTVNSTVGTVAIWDNGKTSYALLDENDMHQMDGYFQEIYQSFKYKN